LKVKVKKKETSTEKKPDTAEVVADEIVDPAEEAVAADGAADALNTEEIDEIIDEFTEDPIDDMTVDASAKKRESLSLNPAYRGLLPISLLAALIGLILGPVPVFLCVFFTGRTFYPLYVAAPLIMYFFNSLLRGGRDIRMVVITAVFSLASAYLTILASLAALYTAAINTSIFQIPIYTSWIIGEPAALPKTASTIIYPLLFTALGIAITAELLRSPKKKLPAAEYLRESDSLDDDSHDGGPLDDDSLVSEPIDDDLPDSDSCDSDSCDNDSPDSEDEGEPN
jgi:hypothetical protein